MFEKLKEINPFNWFEKFVLKRAAKKLVKIFPDLKEKGVKIIEEHAEEFFNKIQITVLKFIEEYENK